MNLREELNTFDWKVNYIMQRPVPAQRQLAVLSSRYYGYHILPCTNTLAGSSLRG